MTTIPNIKFGQAISEEELDQLCMEWTSKEERQCFQENYNDIVENNYAKVRFVQRISLLGPLAGLFLTIKGVLEQRQLSQQYQDPVPSSTTLLLGLLVLCVSTLTAVATAQYLRELLVEQVQELTWKYQQKQRLVDDNDDWNCETGVPVLQCTL